MVLLQKYKRQLFILACSFLIALPLNPDNKKKETLNGCGLQYYTHMDNFYKEKKNSIEVIALGDSNVYRSFSPMIYWRDTHAASFSLASASQPAWLSYYVLQDALTYQKPKVILFEINELFADEKGKIPRNCSTINTLKSGVRLKAIHDVNNGMDEEDRMMLYEAYVTSIYKTSMENVLSDKAFTRRIKDTHNFKGYLLNNSVIPSPAGKSYMSRHDIKLSINKTNAHYIKNIIQLCKKENIKLLFVKFPTSEWTAQKSKLASTFAQTYHIPFLDLNMDMDTIDWMKDTKDAGFHLNDKGAEKTTVEVEKFINQYAAINATQDKEVYASYENSFKRYIEIREKNINHDVK